MEEARILAERAVIASSGDEVRALLEEFRVRLHERQTGVESGAGVVKEGPDSRPT
jgi:hypothetical protein